MRLAVISDIHGNLPALESVLTDIQSQQVDHILNLGDIVSGGLFPAETAERLMFLRFPTIRGNHERQLLDQDVSDMGPSDRHAFEQLTPQHWEWLRQLPEELSFNDDILMVHGAPGNDLIYLLEDVTARGVYPSSEARVLSLVANTRASLILCGHTHIPRKLHLADGRLIVNPGSVGLQAASSATRSHTRLICSRSEHRRSENRCMRPPDTYPYAPQQEWKNRPSHSLFSQFPLILTLCFLYKT